MLLIEKLKDQSLTEQEKRIAQYMIKQEEKWVRDIAHEKYLPQLKDAIERIKAAGVAIKDDKARALTVSGGISNKMPFFHFIYFCEMYIFMVIMWGNDNSFVF